MKRSSFQRRLTSRGLLMLLALLLLLMGVAAAPQQQSSKKLLWESYSVDLEVQPNGDIAITENQRIRFTSGTFTFGTATIPLDRVESIGDVRVSENTRVYSQSATGREYTFSTSQDGNNLNIIWYFPPTAGSTRTFSLRYTARRAVHVPPNLAGTTCDDKNDVVDWNAIPSDHAFGINEAHVNLSLPAPVLSDAQGPFARAYGGSANMQVSPDGRTIEWSSGYIPANQGIEVCAAIPAGTIAGGKPQWQANMEAAKQREAVIGSIALIVAIPMLIGGVLLALALYYTRGRDPQVGAVAEYLSEPPANLPPGVAGTLIDERADLQDILSTLVDLARRGKLDMQELQAASGWGAGTDFVFHRTAADSGDLRPYENALLDRVFQGGSERRLSELKQRFYTSIPQLQSQLYGEVVKEGFFSASPQSVRQGYLVVGGLLLALAVAGGICGAAIFNAEALLCPAASLGLFALLLMGMSGAMPARTRKGAEESAKWQAFKRYLQNTEKYTDMQAAKDQFERYLPYAIAFGLERTWINRFARMADMPPPIWYYPAGVPYGGYGRYGYPRASAGPAGGSGMPPVAGSGQVPSLGDVSTRMAGGLQNMSNGLLTMLNTAGATFTSVPPSSNSGGFRGGGGGFHGGGGGGGGARGFG